MYGHPGRSGRAAPAAWAAWRAILAVLAVCLPAAAAAPGGSPLEKPPGKRLKPYPTRYYVIYTDLGEDAIRETAARMTAMAEEYHDRTRGFAGAIRQRFPFYIYSNEKEYHDAGGVKGSMGVYDGGRQVLMALAEDGLSDRLWYVVQHEGFHQFCHVVIGGRLPIWIKEGLAEYFAEGLWTGDGFVTGVIPPYRLKRVQEIIEKEKIVSFLDILMMSAEEWSGALEEDAKKREKKDKKDPFEKDPNTGGKAKPAEEDAIERSRIHYDQAWSMIHFLVHADNGKYRESLSALIRDVAGGRDWQQSFQARFGRNVKPFEKAYKDWWTARKPEESRDLYLRAVMQILTSFLARAVSQGQKSADLEEFLREARAGTLKGNKAQWLPPKLLEDSLLAARNWQPAMSLQTTGRNPSLVLTWPDGTVFTGTYTCAAGKAENVKVAVTAPKKP